MDNRFNTRNDSGDLNVKAMEDNEKPDYGRYVVMIIAAIVGFLVAKALL